MGGTVYHLVLQLALAYHLALRVLGKSLKLCAYKDNKQLVHGPLVGQQ